MKVWNFLWTNRTRTFGFIQGLIAVLAGLTDIFSMETIKWLLAGNALLTYSLGQFNSWQAKRETLPEPAPEAVR
jgi:hypothetical protein